MQERNLGEGAATSQASPTIVVFGAAVADDGAPSATLIRRLEATLAAAVAHPLSPILVTGGAVRSRCPEAMVMAAWLEAAGIARTRFVLEDRALTTWDSAARIAALVASTHGDGAPRVVLVTSGYHAPRCRLFLRLHRVAIAAVVAPPDERRRMGNAAWMIAIARELAALPWNVLRVLAKRLRWT